jgi:hypothetical protein
VRRYRDVLGRHGGYILGPTHLFQPDVPPENILAVYREDRRVGNREWGVGSRE